MREIILQFASEYTPGSLLISFGTRGWCAHVDAVVNTKGDLLGARPFSGVMVRPANYMRFRRTKVVYLPTTKQIHDDFYDFIYDQCGKRYDYGALVSYAINRDWRTNDNWFCSELIAAGLEVSGFFPYRLSNDVNKISPSDLLLLCSVCVNLFGKQQLAHPFQNS